MNMIQKLPVALALACTMMLSSCSKEDASTPQPMNEEAGVYSGAKTSGEEISAAPFLPSTLVAFEVNYNSLPRFWEKVPQAPNLTDIPAGSSSLTSLWNHSDKPWKKALAPAPTTPTGYSMVTTKSFTPFANETSKRSKVFTKIEGLKVGKTYSVTFYVATTQYKELYGHYMTDPAYAKTAQVIVIPANTGQVTTNIDLTGKEAEWVKKTITFKAKETYAKFLFSCLTPLVDTYSFAHLIVAPNSIKELTTLQPMVIQPVGL